MKPGSGIERLVVRDEQAGIRLDKLLAALPSIGSRESARKVLRSGKVEIDGVTAGIESGGQPLAVGAAVSIRWNQPGTGARIVAAQEAMTRAGVVVRHEDEDIIVVDKPAGLLTDAADQEQARHQDTLRKRVTAWLGGRMVWPAHRIDRYTTGLVMFARNESARQHLKEQWIARTPVREYRAWVEGRFSPASGRFCDWMIWDTGALLQRPTAPNTPGAWRAEADFEIIERYGDQATELRIRLVTGRRNQIRLHAMLAGHPLIGEVLYRIPNERARSPNIPFPRQALHAARLVVVHPRTGESMQFVSPLPSDLEQLIRRLA